MMNHTDTLSIACTACTAAAGTYCITKNGNKAHALHTVRIAAAELAAQAAASKAAIRKLSSHANCDHEATKVARAKCRRAKATVTA